MSDIMKCPHCGKHLGQTDAVLNLNQGKVHFRSWLCPCCGTRVETRSLGSEPEETLLISPPQIDSAQRKQAEHQAQWVPPTKSWSDSPSNQLILQSFC
ncbi:MAG: hypothetical protein EOM37_15180 [Proteobacteria bacterium]|nr:hypothetical protein [Pseudomonadota bacterium]